MNLDTDKPSPHKPGKKAGRKGAKTPGLFMEILQCYPLRA